MAVADSSCSVEKDSLRAALNSEQAKTKNWEQSYETCVRALTVAIEANEKRKEKEIQSKSQAAMMTSSSFIGGLAVGIICFEAIGSSSPLDSNCLSLALRAQPLRRGHGQASLPATLALRGCH